MRKELRRQRLSAWLLLVLYVPMLLAVSLHIHTVTEADDLACEECLHHVCHEQHVGQQSFSMDDCVLCQLHSATYVLPSTFTLTYYNNDIHTPLTTLTAILPATVVSHHAPRAPPVAQLLCS